MTPPKKSSTEEASDPEPEPVTEPEIEDEEDFGDVLEDDYFFSGLDDDNEPEQPDTVIEDTPIEDTPIEDAPMAVPENADESETEKKVCKWCGGTNHHENECEMAQRYQREEESIKARLPETETKTELPIAPEGGDIEVPERLTREEEDDEEDTGYDLDTGIKNTYRSHCPLCGMVVRPRQFKKRHPFPNITEHPRRSDGTFSKAVFVDEEADPSADAFVALIEGRLGVVALRSLRYTRLVALRDAINERLEVLKLAQAKGKTK